MARPERQLDPQAGPVQAFAAELRLVREKAGSPKYLQMARATGRSRTALAEAAGGDHLPTWETVEAYLTACGQNPAAWQTRWEEARADLDRPQVRLPTVAQEPSSRSAPATEPQQAAQAGPRRPRPHRPRPAVTGVLSLAAAALAFALFHLLTAGGAASRPGVDAQAASTVPVTVVVQNKVVSGPSGFYEDTTPVYLSTLTEPMCARNGCEVPGTRMWSGAVLQVVCQTQGASMTNEDLHSPAVATNPHGATSSRWYRAEMPTGTAGYISEVYLTPASRGGLGLPACPPQ